MKKGFTLLEILVVVSVFAVLGILVTRSVILSVTGSRKSEAIVKVRENLDYSSGVIERLLRNALSVPVCPNPDPLTIAFKDQLGRDSTFACVDIGSATGGYVASGSGTLSRLTSDSVDIIGCSFTCTLGTGNNPPSVTVYLNAKDATAIGIQGAEASITTQVSLRNY